MLKYIMAGFNRLTGNVDPHKANKDAAVKLVRAVVQYANDNRIGPRGVRSTRQMFKAVGQHIANGHYESGSL